MPDEPPIHLTGEEARGGDIVLRKRRQRVIFIAGLIGLAIIALAGWFVG